jgi:transketolase
MNNISPRDAFWNKIYELAKKDKDIVIITADMGAPSLDKFRKNLSSQFVNVGIAEQNAITLAAGLTLAGKKVFTYAIAPFITLRCLEQIRVENAIMKIPITIVGVGVGFGYEDSGPTHHLIEDVAIMRTMPNIRIDNITDNVMAEYFARQCCKKKTITDYIRLDRLTHPDIYDRFTDFSEGLIVAREGGDYYIISAGSMIPTALETAAELSRGKIKIGVIDIFSLPVNGKKLSAILKKTKKIVCLEEHFLPGGLGSAVAEVLCDNGLPIPLKRIGIPLDKGYCYKYGGREVIREYYGIDKRTAIAKIKNFIQHG